MKIEKYENLKSKKPTYTVITKIKRFIERDIMIKGFHNKQILLYTTEGWFSGLLTVWNKQNIEIDQLNDEIPVEITYTKNVSKKDGLTYNNFKSIVTLPKDFCSRLVKTDEDQKDENSELIDALDL